MSSALVAKPTPGRVGTSEKPKPGSDAATTWKLGAFGSPCAAGIRQQRDQLEHLHERARPAVQQQHGDRVRVAALRVDEMDARAVDGRAIVLEAVQRAFLLAPVVLPLPIVDELAQVRRVRAVAPARARQLIGPARAREPLVEIAEHGGGHVDREALDARALALSARWRREAHRKSREARGGEQPGVTHVVILRRR